MKKYILSIIIVLSTSIGVRAQMIGINTDLVWDACCVPSLGIEVGTGNSTSFVFNAFGGRNPWGMKDANFAGIQPEFRYWLAHRAMHKEFLGVGSLFASYKFPLAGKIYDGYTAGLGMTLGYAFKMNKRFVLNVHAGCGALFYNQKEYFKDDNFDMYTNSYGEVEANAHGFNILPTNFGVTITYIIH